MVELDRDKSGTVVGVERRSLSSLGLFLESEFCPSSDALGGREVVNDIIEAVVVIEESDVVTGDI